MRPIPPEQRTYADELPDPDERPAWIAAACAGIALLIAAVAVIVVGVK